MGQYIIDADRGRIWGPDFQIFVSKSRDMRTVPLSRALGEADFTQTCRHIEIAWATIFQDQDSPFTAPVGSLDKLNSSREAGGRAGDDALPVQVDPPAFLIYCACAMDNVMT